ncbi:DUF2244 domain-containing protein [Pararhizobium arenae]|uniref:DUF2244 domain-containing protein n=1 Tax=Pararhizobium arenae TaxID=1856850 RepID=UPI00094B42AF|nr:DUF2244 domain-containing protein [Pararhizobium arenae]
MNDGNGEMTNQDKPVFEAELTPYRSLGMKGFKVLFLIAGLMSLVHVFVFMLMGAWPVVFFFGLDYALLLGAFWLNYRAARAREEVLVSRTDVRVRKFTPAGQMTEHNFNPFWARFNIARHSEIGIVSMNISDRRRATDIGMFLNRDDRESFAKAFSGALATVKRR